MHSILATVSARVALRRRLLDLAFLPPKLVEAILEGAQPVDMTAEQLSRAERGLLWSGVRCQ